MSTYLVTQATGQQSQSVIKHLLTAGKKVHAVVRNPEKAPEILESPDVTVFKGESVDFDAVFQAAQGCSGVFLNTFPIPGLETQQAATIVEASKKAGVEAIVASTTLCTGDKSYWDNAQTEKSGLHGYYSSKASVEDAVRGAGFKTYTILRPGVIHFDFLLPGAHYNWPELPQTGVLNHAFEEGGKAVYTDGDDIGKYAVAAFQNPARFGGQEIDLGNESLTIKETRDIIAKVSGRNVGVRKRTPAEIEELMPTLFSMRFQIFGNLKDFGPLVAAVPEIQAKFGIPFTSLEQGLQRDKTRLLECLPVQ